MKLEFFIGYHYLKAKSKKRNLVSFAAFAAVAGVFLGVLVPIVVMSVMNGFQMELKDKILGLQSHIVVYGRAGSPLTGYKNLKKEILTIPDITSVTEVIEMQGLVTFYGKYRPVMLKGVREDYFTNTQSKELFQFQEGAGAFEKRGAAYVGNVLKQDYYLRTNQRLSVITVSRETLFTPKPVTVPLNISGFFGTGYYEHDRQMFYTGLPYLQKKLGMNASVTKLEVKVDDPWHADQAASKINQMFSGRYSVYTWKELNANTFSALQTERVLLWLVVIFILVVAIFNVMSSQIMLVLEKRKEIGILKTIGMTPFHIVKVFLSEGAVTTALGAIPGAVIGHYFAKYIDYVLRFIEWGINTFNLFVYKILSLFHASTAGIPRKVEFFPSDIYYFDSLPVDLSLEREIIIFLTAVILSLVAGMVPSVKAAGLKPVEVIRYE